jgi:hypothetical protein
MVQKVSGQLKDLLWEVSPDVPAAAEAFATEVIYVPVSATGCSPTVDANGAIAGIRPRDVNPIWVEVPMLAVLCKWATTLVHRFEI